MCYPYELRVVTTKRWVNRAPGFYWRDAIILLCDGLADTTHTLELLVEEAIPDMSILKRPPSSTLWERFRREAQEAGRPPQKLWMLYACAVEADIP